MTGFGPYPDARAAVGDVISGAVSAVYLGSQTLAHILEGQLPAVRIARTGGGDDGFTDTSELTLTWFGPDADTVWAAAEASHQLLLSLRLPEADNGTAAGLIDYVDVDQAPQLASAPDVAVTQIVKAAYSVQMRRTAQ